MLRRVIVFSSVGFLLGLGSLLLRAQQPEAGASDPEILSMFPLAGERGKVWQAELRGRLLHGAYAVWFDCKELYGSVKSVETINLDTRKDGSESSPNASREGQRVLLELGAHPDALVGAHKVRLIASRGVSNSFALFVHREPVVLENQTAFGVPAETQEVSWPAVVSGRISKEGEVDHFAVEVPGDHELHFEMVSSGAGFDPGITVFEPSGSWLDAHRLIRLAGADAYGNNGVNLGQVSTANLNHRFKKGGRYIVAAGALLGLGGSDFSYQLRIVESAKQAVSPWKQGGAAKWAHGEPQEWEERGFSRKIEPDRLRELWSRTVRVSKKDSQAGNDVSDSSSPEKGSASRTPVPEILDGASPVPIVPVVKEQEPNDTATEALNVELPVILEGTIDRPGDSDSYRIQVTAGQALAFEMATLQEAPPSFNPHLEVLDALGQTVLNNVYQQIGGDGDDWLQSLESKCIYTFEQEGEFILKIRDLTPHTGSSRFVYRLLVRPQIPHVGDVNLVEIEDTQNDAKRALNLFAGEAKKLTVRVGQEEEFDGQVIISVRNLPSGVVCLPAVDVDPSQGPAFAKVHPERFVPRKQSATLMLYAHEDAPATPLPHAAILTAQPVVQGKPGLVFEVKEFPIMVLKSPPSSLGRKVLPQASLLP